MNGIIQFLTQHGAFVLFAVVLAEQIGLPLPALPFLIAAGALVGTGQMDLGVAVGSAILSALVGDRLWFELGRRQGRRQEGPRCDRPGVRERVRRPDRHGRQRPAGH